MGATFGREPERLRKSRKLKCSRANGNSRTREQFKFLPTLQNERRCGRVRGQHQSKHGACRPCSFPIKGWEPLPLPLCSSSSHKNRNGPSFECFCRIQGRAIRALGHDSPRTPPFPWFGPHLPLPACTPHKTGRWLWHPAARHVVEMARKEWLLHHRHPPPPLPPTILTIVSGYTHIPTLQVFIRLRPLGGGSGEHEEVARCLDVTSNTTITVPSKKEDRSVDRSNPIFARPKAFAGQSSGPAASNRTDWLRLWPAHAHAHAHAQTQLSDIRSLCLSGHSTLMASRVRTQLRTRCFR